MSEWVPGEWLINVLRIGGANFLHCSVANFIWLDCAELLITKQYSFHGECLQIL